MRSFIVVQAIFILMILVAIIIGWRALADRIVALEECCYHVNSENSLIETSVKNLSDAVKITQDEVSSLKAQNGVLVDRLSAISSRLPVKYSPTVSDSIKGVTKVRVK